MMPLFHPLPQALFAGSIPEIIDIVKTFPKYNGTYVNDRGRRHVNKNKKQKLQPHTTTASC